MRYQMSTPVGRISVVEEHGYIKELLPSRFGDDSTYEKSKLGKQLKSALDAYFKGDREALLGIPVEPEGTEFQKQVWAELRQIPVGETLTYSDMAQRLGRKGASRAVGTACGRNPILFLVPCHRVVAKTGLGGFIMGLDIKKNLLNLES